VLGLWARPLPLLQRPAAPLRRGLLMDLAEIIFCALAAGLLTVAYSIWRNP
jgi:hypothetical protein